MGRWEPNAEERLRGAAMELFAERGYDGTTAREIAARAGLTERTFFRYFADKREVLFAGAASLEGLVVAAIEAEPGHRSSLDAVVAGLVATSAMFEERRAFARARHRIVGASPELYERELIKLSSLSLAIGRALVARGERPPVASLVAEIGIALFRSAFERWVDDDAHDLAHHVRAAVGEMRNALASGEGEAPSRAIVGAEEARGGGRATKGRTSAAKASGRTGAAKTTARER